MLDEREPSVDQDSGMYTNSVSKPREGSAESDHAGSLFSGGEDAEDVPGPSNANAVAGPSSDMPAAHRNRAGKQQEVNRSDVPAHRLRREFHLVQRIEPHELLAAGATATSSNQDATVPAPTEPTTTNVVSDSRSAGEVDLASPSRLPRSIMTIDKGGKLNVVRTKDGHYIEKQRVPSKRTAEQRAAQSQSHPPRSVSGSVHGSPPPASTSTPARITSDIEPIDNFGRNAEEAPEEPQSMDIFDDFVYLSDSSAPAHPDSASRRYVLDLPTLSAPEDIAQPISMQEEVLPTFSPPHSSPNRLLYASTVNILAPHSLMSGIKPAVG